jgi:hypothetical protein
MLNDDDNIHNDEFNLTPDFGLSTSERAIADLYRGGSDSIDDKTGFTGHKTRCYHALHPRASKRTAEKRASELFQKPAMVAYLETKAKDLQRISDMNSETLLMDANRLKRICFGDEYFVDTIMVDGKPEEVTYRKFNAGGVKGALEVQGRILGAFSDKLEHTGKDGSDLIPTTFTVKYVSNE